MADFQIDNEGNVIMKPVTGWLITHAGEVAVLAGIEYVESPQELETGDKHQIPLVLLPQQCLDLAAALTTAAQRLLNDSVDPSKLQ